MLLLDRRYHRLDDMERQADAARELGARQLAREVQRLENQLRDEIARKSRLLERPGRGKFQQCGPVGCDHWGCSTAIAACRACTERRRAIVKRGSAAASWSKIRAASVYRPSLSLSTPTL